MLAAELLLRNVGCRFPGHQVRYICGLHPGVNMFTLAKLAPMVGLECVPNSMH